MSDDDDTFVLAAVAAFFVIKNKNKKRTRANPYLKERNDKGRSRDFQNMLQEPNMFYENFHMTERQFELLFAQVEPHLVTERNTRPDAIPLKAKFGTVLEYLASGDLQRHIGSTYRNSKHLETSIALVCSALVNVLKAEFPIWNKHSMSQWAQAFMEQCNFPNCIGAIDGKHVAIQAPDKSVHAFYNTKGFHSIILLGVCDASHKFTYIDVGAYGSEGDMNAFSHSTLGNAFLSEQINFPEDSLLNGVRTPYFLVADDAFPLAKRIMKPYGHRQLQRDERIFNYRLSRAHRCIENTFGILSKRWMATQRTLLCDPERAQQIVAACCGLHNYLMRTGPVVYGNTNDLPPNVSKPTNDGARVTSANLAPQTYPPAKPPRIA